ncbi:MAG: hypothetical protein OWS74_07415, partial [Firmicutes bacterium]|nr:hypothetical protein [Bacillota bacterium]
LGWTLFRSCGLNLIFIHKFSKMPPVSLACAKHSEIFPMELTQFVCCFHHRIIRQHPSRLFHATFRISLTAGKYKALYKCFAIYSLSEEAG